MARDGKLTLRFVQQAFAAGNLMAVNNYAMSTTVPSTGAAFLMTTGGTNSFYYHGFSQTLNRTGYRTMNADQSLLLGTETSATVNDPALFGGTNGVERYMHAVVQSFGAYGTGSWEVFAQGASDSGTGTAGTDWTQVSGSVILNSTSLLTVTSTGIAGGLFTSATAHSLNVGDVLIPATSGTNFAQWQPLIVVSTPTPTTAGLSKIAGGAQDATLGGGAVVFWRPSQKRVVAIPMTATTKPWIRLMVRAVPVAGANAIPVNTGAWVDQVYITMGRDAAAVS